jgi:hypothetical protein
MACSLDHPGSGIFNVIFDDLATGQTGQVEPLSLGKYAFLHVTQ